MHVLIAYDISNNKTRSRLFAFLKEKGFHSQKSVFECELDRETLHSVQEFVRSMELGDNDSVVFYPLCRRCAGQGMILGQGLQLTQTDWIVI